MSCEHKTYDSAECPTCHEAREAITLGKEAFAVLRRASAPRVAFSALHVVIASLAEAMGMTTLALAEQIVEFERKQAATKLS